jgi:Gly-Xaa carboxypeptidase
MAKSPNYTLLSQAEVEANDFESRRRRWAARNHLKWGFALLVNILALLSIAALVKRGDNAHALFPEIGSEAACPQYPAITSVSSERAEFEELLTTKLNSDEFFKASTKRMQGAIRIPTESFDDMGLVGEDKRWDIFVDFHKYLEETFPLV